MTIRANIYKTTDRPFGWVARTVDGKYIGHGADEAEAVMDLKMQIAGESWETVKVVRARDRIVFEF